MERQRSFSHGPFEAVVVESQAKDGRSGLHGLEAVRGSMNWATPRSGKIAQTKHDRKNKPQK